VVGGGVRYGRKRKQNREQSEQRKTKSSRKRGGKVLEPRWKGETKKFPQACRRNEKISRGPGGMRSGSCKSKGKPQSEAVEDRETAPAKRRWSPQLEAIEEVSQASRSLHIGL